MPNPSIARPIIDQAAADGADRLAAAALSGVAAALLTKTFTSTSTLRKDQ